MLSLSDIENIRLAERLLRSVLDQKEELSVPMIQAIHGNPMGAILRVNAILAEMTYIARQYEDK